MQYNCAARISAHCTTSVIQEQGMKGELFSLTQAIYTWIGACVVQRTRNRSTCLLLAPNRGGRVRRQAYKCKLAKPNLRSNWNAGHFAVREREKETPHDTGEGEFMIDFTVAHVWCPEIMYLS